MNAKLFSISLLAAGVLLASASQSNASGYTFTDLGTGHVRDINNANQIVGYVLDSDGSGRHQATLWSGGTIINLGRTGIDSGAFAINDAGQVTGESVFGSGDQHATIWNGNVATDLGGGGVYSQGRAINDLGQVAGNNREGGISHPVWWNDSGMHNLSLSSGFTALGINNTGQVVGIGGADGNRAFLWSGGAATELGKANSEAYAINNAGQVVGGYVVSGTNHATIWNGTTPTDLGTLPGGGSSSAYAINSAGLVAGKSTSSNGEVHATLWNGIMATDLNSFLDVSMVSAGWVLTEAWGINDSGWIVGQAFNNQLHQEHGFLLAPVPEPETYALFMAGLGLMGFIARRRKNGQA